MEFMIKIRPEDPDRPARPQMRCHRCPYSGDEDTFVDLRRNELNCPVCHSQNVR